MQGEVCTSLEQAAPRVVFTSNFIQRQSWKVFVYVAPKWSVSPLLGYSTLPSFLQKDCEHTQSHINSIIPPIFQLHLREANSLPVTEFSRQRNLILIARAWLFCLSWATLCTDLYMMFEKHQSDCTECDALFLAKATLFSCVLSSTWGLTCAHSRTLSPVSLLFAYSTSSKPLTAIFLVTHQVPFAPFNYCSMAAIKWHSRCLVLRGWPTNTRWTELGLSLMCPEAGRLWKCSSRNSHGIWTISSE